MHYHVSFVVKNVHDKELGRDRALVNFVRDNQKWLDAFHKIEDGRYYEMSKSNDRDDFMDYIDAMKKFAKDNGVTVVREQPILEEDRRSYMVNVLYDIDADYNEDS